MYDRDRASPKAVSSQLEGQGTTAIAFNASAATVDAALEALDSINGVTVTTSTSGINRTYTVTFAGTHANTNVALLQAAVKPTGDRSNVRNRAGTGFFVGTKILRSMKGNGASQRAAHKVSGVLLSTLTKN